MSRIDVVKTTFQSRKQYTADGIERGEYIKGMSFVGIIDVCLLIRDNPTERRRFTRYLRWNDAEPDCAENEVLSTYDDLGRRTLWDALISRVLDLSTFDDWINNAVTRFQVITTKGEPILLINDDEPRKREYPTVSKLRAFLPSLPFVRESSLMKPLDVNTALRRNIRLRIHEGQRVILKSYDERETSPELLIEARNITRLTGSYYIIKLLGALVVENYYCVPGPDMISGLLLEYAQQGDLETIFRQHDLVSIPWRRRLKWAYQITHGIADMHDLSVIHGDIKCTNIVVKADDNVAIIDIGEGGRTEGYYWPDDLRKMGADFKLQESGDIYALGVVLWQLTEFRKPVHGETPTVNQDLQIPSEYSSIVAACVVADDLLRPSAPEILDRLSKASS